MQPRLVIFDCDGTLVDSASVIVSAMSAAFTHHDLVPPSPEEIRAIIGLSLPGAVARLVAHHPEAPVDDLVDAYKAAFRDMATRDAALEPTFPGTEETLDALRADPATLLGIATGKSRRGLERVLANHNLTDHFAVTMTADDAPSKPAPAMVLQAAAATGIDPARTVVIGDTTYDMEMARAAGAFAIGVAWGYHPPAGLDAAGAQAIASAMPELPVLIKALIPDD
ncbi:HAD-IA family hydrolase [Acuticoccus sp. M5D2P5]|uniref:HAD-IA family hydrolase n=1 Tax=Acuticoccus kalidii TaxID=2910977 RepID=UPI001F2E7697|nr:HAD-IA family hydrolase [Acuticoccus kalidii]MCF3936314.1 HAD-IA family hydrolase [Acuticoccus kalidii]